MKFKKVLAIVLAAAMCSLTTPVAGFASVVETQTTSTSNTVTIPEGLTDGTYTATSTVDPDEDEDFDAYDITVNVVVAESVIESIQVVGAAGRDTSYSDDAQAGIEEVVIGAASGDYEIDVVSGATCSFYSIVEAINAALVSTPTETDDSFSIVLGDAIYDAEGTSFTVTVNNPSANEEEDVDYSNITLAYSVGKFSSDLEEEAYSVELTSSSDTQLVYTVTVSAYDSGIDDDGETIEVNYNTLGMSLVVSVDGTSYGSITIMAGATVTIEDDAIVLDSSAENVTIADYIDGMSDITIVYTDQETLEEVTVTETLVWAHDVEPTYTASDIVDEDGNFNFDCDLFVYGEDATYEVTIVSSGFDDVTGYIGLPLAEITLGDAVYDPSGSTFTVTVDNPYSYIDYSVITLAYEVGKFSSDLDEGTYTVELTSSSDSQLVYTVTVVSGSDEIDDDSGTIDVTYNSLGMSLKVYVAGDSVGTVSLDSSATVTIEDEAIVLTGGNGETIADYIDSMSDITIVYTDEESGEEVSVTETLVTAHDVEPTYVASDIVNEDGTFNFDCEIFPYGENAKYEVTIVASGFEDLTGTIGIYTYYELGDAVYSPEGSTFDVTVYNPEDDVDYSSLITLAYSVGKFDADVDTSAYTVELVSSSDGVAVYTVTVLSESFDIDDDGDTISSDYNTLGMNFSVYVDGEDIGTAVLNSTATVTIENNALVLTGGNGETIDDYIDEAHEITVVYTDPDSGEEVSTTYTLVWAHDVEPDYTASDIFDSYGYIDFDCGIFPYGADIDYTITVSSSGFDDVTAEVGASYRVVRFIEVAGSNRYATMEAIVSAAFADADSDYAVLATGAAFPDALAAASLAGALDAPIVLVKPGDTASAIAAIEACGATKLYIVGGTGAVSAEDVETITISTDATVVKRLAGSTRLATAVEIAEETNSIATAAGEASTTAIVATGYDFADALSASPYSYWSESPIFLANKDGSVSTDVIDAITEGGYTDIIVIGGTSAVSARGYAQLETISGVTVERVAGTNRYETSADMAVWSVAQGMSYDGAVVATGTNYPDALAAASLCGTNGSVILLAKDGKTDAIDLLDDAEDVWTVYYAGGTGAVTEATRSYIEAFFE